MKKQTDQTKQNHPTPDQIATRAYEIWEAHGRPQGYDLNHWLQAEAELASGQITQLRHPHTQTHLKAAA
jgi:hypothetical protein